MGAETDQPGPTPTLLVQSTPRGRAVVPTMVEGQRGFCRKFHFATLWSRISISATEDHTRGRATMVSFKGAHFVKDMILTCVRWYLAYPLQTTSRFPFRWCGMKPTVSGKSQLDESPEPHCVQEKALDASELRYANPRG